LTRLLADSDKNLADKGKFGVKFRADIGQTTSKKGQNSGKRTKFRKSGCKFAYLAKKY
jgi:hypothetical protein